MTTPRISTAIGLLKPAMRAHGGPFGVAFVIAHAIGVASPVLSSYLLHRNYTFKD